jgi:hypothetical protein
VIRELASGLVYWRRKLQHVICCVATLMSSRKDFSHGLIRSYYYFNPFPFLLGFYFHEGGTTTISGFVQVTSTLVPLLKFYFHEEVRKASVSGM